MIRRLLFVVLSLTGAAIATPVALGSGPAATAPTDAAGDAVGGTVATPGPRIASLATILADIKSGGGRAVLVNIWATWCEPCREELPAILRFYRDNRARGLRLVLISADEEDHIEEVRKVLASTAAGVGFHDDFDARVFVKHDDDMRFINGLDPAWSGALPATFNYDGRGQRRRSWLGPVTAADLADGFLEWLTNPSPGAKTGSKPRPDSKPDSKRRQP